MESCTMVKCVILLCLVALVWTPQGLSADVKQTPDFCKLMPDLGPGPGCMAYIPQFFYNSTSQECETFIYGGCGGNQNRFESKKDCLETCHPHPIHEQVKSDLAEACVLTRSLPIRVCSLPPVAGPCLGYFPMYFHNATSDSCEIFIYGGCRGNANRFKSLSSCQMYCRVPVLNSTEVCNLPPKTGPCKARFPKLFYNPRSQRCEPFIYGGCDGNANRFDSAEECQDVCHPGGNDVVRFTTK
ncbi:carboxypeptidase inhibitor SmCI-like isoform X2 [Eucyclogobius newberryi]|uniref:carboxypeptidase inhibitor SmCI-like isoform X2 n=1 Tax=Eucyclogobius newberryi TaxID=166745 RepID=UPI003B5CCA33